MRTADLGLEKTPDRRTAVAETEATGMTSMRSSWIALSVLFLIYLLNTLDRSILSILSQPIKEELGLADWQLGLMNGLAFTLLYMAAGFPMARWADRGNRTAILSGCLFVWSAMTALCGLAGNFIQLCLFRAGVGMGEAGCLPASHSLISDLFPPYKRTKALAIFGLGLPLGGLVGMTVGGAVMDQWGWRAAFFVAGIPGIAIAVLTWLVVKEPVRARFDKGEAAGAASVQEQSFRDIAWAIWRSPVGRNIIIALTTISLMAGANTVFMGPYMVRKFELGYTELGVIIALTFMLGSAVSTLGGGLLVDWASRFDERWSLWIPAIGIAVGAPLYVAAYAQPTWQGLAVFMFLASVTATTYLAPSFAALHGIVSPNGRARASVIAQFCLMLLGASLGPLLIGFAIDLLAGRLFSASFAATDFLASCPGGRAASGAPEALDIACRAAVVDATQIILMCSLALVVWPAWHFHLAARAMRSQRMKASSAYEGLPQ